MQYLSTYKVEDVTTIGPAKLVVPIILIFMINLNRKSTILKNQINWKIGQKKIDVPIDRWLIFYLLIILFLSSSPVESNFNLKNYPRLAAGEGRVTELRKPKRNRNIDYRKMKRSIIYDWKSMIGSKNWFLKFNTSDQHGFFNFKDSQIL